MLFMLMIKEDENTLSEMKEWLRSMRSESFLSFYALLLESCI